MHNKLNLEDVQTKLTVYSFPLAGCKESRVRDSFFLIAESRCMGLGGFAVT